MILLGGCAVEAPADRDPAADEAAAEEVVGDFFRAMEGWDYQRLRATVTSDFELVEDTVIMTMDEVRTGIPLPLDRDGHSDPPARRHLEDRPAAVDAGKHRGCDGRRRLTHRVGRRPGAGSASAGTMIAVAAPSRWET